MTDAEFEVFERYAKANDAKAVNDYARLCLIGAAMDWDEGKDDAPPRPQ